MSEESVSAAVAQDQVGSAEHQDHLRHVELDVLIPKKMRLKAMELCADYVKEFEDCVRGRTVSMVWKCRELNNKMKNCLAKYYTNPEFFEQCKQEYLEEKQEYQRTGIHKKMKRTH